MVAASVGVGTAVAGLAGSAMQSNASGNAAKDQENASEQSLALQQQMYNDTVQREAPFVNTGTSAMNALASAYGLNGTPNYSAFQNSPQYQFAFNQGQQALDDSAAAKGNLYSGGYGKDLINYGQGMASQQFNSYTTGLNQLASLGQNAASNVGNSGTNTAQMGTNSLASAGNAAAAGTINSANAWSNGLNQLGQAGLGYIGYQSSLPSDMQMIPGVTYTPDISLE